MNIAYLILGHKNIGQVYILIKTLNTEKSFFFVHIDKKYKVKIAEEFLDKKNVVFLSKRIDISWGGYSIVKATLNLMKLAIEHEIKPDYFILLSGQCFPIKSNKEIFDFFKKNNGKIFMSYTKMPDPSQIDGGMFKLRFFWFMDQLGYFNKYFVFGIHKTIQLLSKLFGFERKYLKGYIPYFGSQWWALPGQVVDYVLNFVNQNRSFVIFYKYTFAPDELFFHTIICNSKYKIKVENRLFRFMKNSFWTPEILGIDDLSRLKQSSQLFARKFDINQDPEIIAALIKYIRADSQEGEE
jgi:hypothetical protein